MTPGFTRTPVVPIGGRFVNTDGKLTRTAMMFLQQRIPMVYFRVLLLKDTTVGNDVAEHQYVYMESWLPQTPKIGWGRRIVGLLRLPITADLVVVFHNATKGYTMGPVTIPKATGTSTCISFDIGDKTFGDLDVLTTDVLASDGQKDPGGVASFSVEWTGII